MPKENKIQELLKEENVSQIIQMKYDGKPMREIAEKFNVCVATLYKVFDIIKEAKQSEKPNKELNKNTRQKTPYEILYKNRKEIIKLYKNGMTKVDIAQKFGVKDQDVFDFFNNRKGFNPRQIKDIKEKQKNGMTCEEIANIYQTSKDVIQYITKKTIVAPQSVDNKINEMASDFDCISKFHQYINWVEGQNTLALKKEEELSKSIQDILHKIEFGDYEDSEALSFVNNIKELREERREYKDFIALVAPLIEFMAQDTNAKLLKTLANIAGRVNNKAKQMQNRIYSFKTGFLNNDQNS